MYAPKVVCGLVLLNALLDAFRRHSVLVDPPQSQKAHKRDGHCGRFISFDKVLPGLFCDLRPYVKAIGLDPQTVDMLKQESEHRRAAFSDHRDNNQIVKIDFAVQLVPHSDYTPHDMLETARRSNQCCHRIAMILAVKTTYIFLEITVGCLRESEPILIQGRRIKLNVLVILETMFPCKPQNGPNVIHIERRKGLDVFAQS